MDPVPSVRHSYEQFLSRPCSRELKQLHPCLPYAWQRLPHPFPPSFACRACGCQGASLPISRHAFECWLNRFSTTQSWGASCWRKLTFLLTPSAGLSMLDVFAVLLDF